MNFYLIPVIALLGIYLIGRIIFSALGKSSYLRLFLAGVMFVIVLAAIYQLS
jgi:hypothetical protein